jgi:hypothetical protein
MIGGAVKNGSKESTLVFESFEGIKDNLFTYLTYLFKMNDAGFMGLKIASPETLFLFLHAAVILAGFFVIIIVLRDMLKGTEKDPVSICLSLGFLMISAAVILTDIMVGSQSGRYFCFAPVVFAILIIRYADRLLAKASGKEEPVPFTKTVSGIASFLTSKRYPAVIVVLSLLMITGSLLPFSVSFEPAQTQQTQLADFLVSQGLTCGYAQFWDASAVTVASENKVKVRAVMGANPSRIWKWFCNEDWYDEPANFFVARKVPLFESYSPEKAVKAFGEPQQILENDKYYIYVYDRDISKDLKKRSRGKQKKAGRPVRQDRSAGVLFLQYSAMSLNIIRSAVISSVPAGFSGLSRFRGFRPIRQITYICRGERILHREVFGRFLRFRLRR